MSDSNSIPLVAIDIGNSRVKAGWFDGEVCETEKPTALPIVSRGLPRPIDSVVLGSQSLDEQETRRTLESWLAGHSHLTEIPWIISSVHRHREDVIAKLLVERGCQPPRILSCRDIPFPIRVKHPEQVGMDRLMGAVAANRVRPSDGPAIVVDLGSAITVDLIGEDGAFEGGLILPGVAMGVAALRAGTDALPESSLVELHEPPPLIGKSTIEAIDSGLYWGAVGSIRHIIATIVATSGPVSAILLTGGAAESVAAHIASDSVPVLHVPHLILAGIALTARGN